MNDQEKDLLLVFLEKIYTKYRKNCEYAAEFLTFYPGQIEAVRKNLQRAIDARDAQVKDVLKVIFDIEIGLKEAHHMCGMVRNQGWSSSDFRSVIEAISNFRRMEEQLKKAQVAEDNAVKEDQDKETIREDA